MRYPQILAVGLASAALLSCGGGDLVLPTEGEPASITIKQGNGLRGRVGEVLPESLVVQVFDGADRPVPDATVVVELSGAVAEPDTLSTDGQGLGSAQITLGSQVGDASGTVRVIAPESPAEVRATFTVTAVAASASGLALVSGDEQSGVVGTELPDPLVVEVTDPFGNPTEGVTITWTAEGGGSVSAVSTVTDAQGRTSVTRTLGPTAGTQTTLASSEEGLAGSPVIFTHTATAGSPSGVSIVSGNNQEAPPGTTLPDDLVVAVVDEDGNPVVGAPVTWVVTAGGGSLDPATGTTDGNGRAATRWTLGSNVGANTAQAIVSGVGQAVFSATATGGAPDEIRIVSGNDQRGEAGSPLGQALVVQVLDQNDNPAPGATVRWSVESGGGSVSPGTATTGADGRASTNWTLGSAVGTQRVRASVQGAGSVDFEATSTPGPASVLGIVTQPPASGQVGVQLRRQPVIQVRDAAGNPVRTAGVTVTAAIATGAGSLSGTTTQTTDGDGRATFTNLAITGAVGMHSIIFAAPGFTSATSNGIDVNPAETAIRIVSDAPDESAPGEDVTVVFEVTTLGAAPPGSMRVDVTTSGGPETCSATVAEGRCNIRLEAEGNRILTATFVGSALYTESSDTEPHRVVAPDTPPTARDDAYSATGGVTLSVPASQGVLANDFDPDGDPLTASRADGPQHGTLDLRPDGSFEYLPNPGNWGEDRFTYDANAGGVATRGTVVIIVNRAGP
ncbi:MAG TPA: Ig-like domain-containing protein [Gemmatimonadales bacterium]|nr:Ig-like domain-containing protein [Gemmatimonadales bacterium]